MSVVPSLAVFSSPKASEAADHGHDMHENLGEIHFRSLRTSSMHSFKSATNMVVRVMKNDNEPIHQGTLCWSFIFCFVVMILGCKDYYIGTSSMVNTLPGYNRLAETGEMY